MRLMGWKEINKRPFNRKNIEDVSNIPGVYELLDADGDTAYVGKSNRLRDRFHDHMEEFSAKHNVRKW